MSFARKIVAYGFFTMILAGLAWMLALKLPGRPQPHRFPGNRWD